MPKLHQTFLTTAWRGLKGMVVGAGTCLLVAVTGMGVMSGASFLLDIPPPIDYWERSRRELLLAAIAVVLVGGIAGLAARLPRNGMTMLWSITIVGGCAGLAVLLTRRAHEDPSRILITLGAIAGGVIVLVYGILVTRRSNADVRREEGSTDTPKESSG